MNILIKNTIVRLTGHHDSKRILYISSVSDLVASISMCGHRCAPSLSSYSEWLSMLDRGDMEIMEDSNLDLPFNHSLSDAMRSRKERAWDAIEPLIKDIPAIFQPSYRTSKLPNEPRRFSAMSTVFGTGFANTGKWAAHLQLYLENVTDAAPREKQSQST